MWTQMIILPVTLIALAVIFLRFNFTITTVHGSSMYPTLQENDRLLTFNLLPRLWLRKGQIVVSQFDEAELPAFEEVFSNIDGLEDLDFEFNDELADLSEVELEPEPSKIIKRVIGLPGDTVIIPLSSLSPEMQEILRSRADANGNLVWSVPKEHCFLKGDGQFSMDSLIIGCIPLSKITGITLLKLSHSSPSTDTFSFIHPIQ
jgi:signal peptidase I